ncbi:MAG: leucyl aminopeptidase family protein [Alphaproteobacteria bacterium]|nr:leucyl aminopeptidase family protein [Alphaproteobacteria bacterium]
MGSDPAVPLVPLTRTGLPPWLETRPDDLRRWVAASGFAAEAGEVCLVPDGAGGVGWALAGLGDGADPWLPGLLPARLPPALYRIGDGLAPDRMFPLAWAVGTYAFDRYKTATAGRGLASLMWPPGCDRALVESTVEAIFLVRDLVNTPAADMGPQDLAAAARGLSDRHGARLEVIEGEGLLSQGYPAIHAVGRASSRPPCLIDLRWGDVSAPRVTLVGKGVCFDSGGLDLKPADGMKLMKKDMGGAAHVLALAGMIMRADLPLRLRVLIPAVDNAVSGSSFRPLDVLRTRKGLSVEVGNTDAEGRLILADALAEGDSERPELLIDCATLTGAARSALGPDIPALFSNDDRLAADLLRHADAESDPLWRLPLWKPYRKILDSKVADIGNSGDSPHAGAITAALFLAEFVEPATSWAHLDLYAWTSARPGRPEGGEAMGLRALFALIAGRYPKS